MSLAAHLAAAGIEVADVRPAGGGASARMWHVTLGDGDEAVLR